MSNLRQGWIRIPLSQIGKWSSGGTPSRRNSEYFGKGVPWVKSGDLPDGPITVTEEQITELGLNNSSAKLMPAGTISLALYGATIGKLGVMTFPAATNQACANVVPDERLIDPQYLFFYLMSERDALINKGQGGAQPNISQQIVKAHDILLAPLNEQRRIVGRLEKLLSRVNTAQERLATFPRTLKRFRQSVIAAACAGKLTAVWRDGNPIEETAFDFVQRIHAERIQRHQMALTQSLTNGGRRPKKGSNNDFVADINGDLNTLLLGWWVTGIGDICDCLDRLRVPINKGERLRRQGCIPYYGANGQVGNIDDYIFDEDLVLVVEDETFIGREKPFSYVIKGKTWVNNHAHVLRPLGGMSAEFLNILLSYYDFTPLTSGTTGRRKLNQEALVNAPIRLPPFNEQHEIVRRVETLFKTADALEGRYLKAKAHVDKLTQSILAKAFRGELVPQDPSDEPASVLLERITSERNGSAVVKRRSRK